MIKKRQKQSWGSFFGRIILPTLLAITIFVGSIYFVLIPAFERSFLENKREMIQELTSVAWSVLELYETEEKAGRLSRKEAQAKAIAEIQHLHYGDSHQDYFWITDLSPVMVMHPYSPELNGTDVSQYKDSGGKRVFYEMKELANQKGSGFLDYFWHSKYDTQENVQKLSYVKKFSPWGWIVGTGIFLDDVQEKIETITGRLFSMAFGFIAVLTFLLFYVNHQSLIIERKRRMVEDKLKLSMEKYKKLAEASIDPMMMIYDNKCIYSNKSMWALVGYSSEEMDLLDPFTLFPENNNKEKTGRHNLQSSLEGEISEEEHEGSLQNKNGQVVDVLLRFSKMTLGDSAAVVMVAKDASRKRQLEEQLESSRDKYSAISNQLNIGIIRTRPDEKFEIIEANPATTRLVCARGDDELLESELLAWFEDGYRGEDLQETLLDKGCVKDMEFLRRRSGKVSRVFSVSMVLTRDGKGQPLYCDCVLEDITEQKKREQERENLIVELQTSLLFLNQPIKHVLHDFVMCDLETSVGKAAQIMSKDHLSAILVRSESGAMVGIVTDVAMRERVIAENLSYDIPVYEIMSSPLIYIDDSALIFEAALLMQEKGIKHLVVRNGSGEVVSVITNEELLHVHRYSTAFLINEIQDAESIDEIFITQERMPRIVKALTDSGAHARNITRVITTISDAILERLIDFAIEELGEPPCSFAFISLGSEGRGEQTLVTDQDNAIIFEDVAEENLEAVKAYFNSFGTKVCTWLDKSGYDFCKGNVMAMNPQWCQPLFKWKECFSGWVLTSEPQDLLEVNIFFDFRCLYGENYFTDQLREHITQIAEKRAVFFQHLATNILVFKPPVDFFGNIAVESGGDHANSFDIKFVIAAIVGFARVYSVKNGLESTNTLQRIDTLLERNIINSATHAEIVGAYNYLMQMRFRHQVKMINDGLAPDNFINLDELSHMEKVMLKKTFSQVSSFQKHLSYESTGIA